MPADLEDMRLEFVVNDDGSVTLKKIERQHDRTSKAIEKGANRAGRAIDRMRRKLPTTAQAFSRMGAKIVRIGKRMAQVFVAAMAAIGVASLKAAVDFEYGMAEVSTLVDTSVVDMEKMGAGVLKLSGELGQSSKLVTRGLYQAISAGVDAGKALQFMEVAGRAAIAGITDIDTAVDGLTTILNSYGLSVAHATRISDEMFQTVKEGKLVFADIANVIGRASTMAASLGVESSHLMAALATLTKVGLNAHQSATALRAIFVGLLKPTSQAVEAAQRYNVQLNSAAIATMGFAGYLRHIRTQLKAATTSEKEFNEALAELFPNIRGLTGIMALGGEAMEEFERITKSVEESAGAASTAFEKVADTAKKAWDRLRATFKSEMIKWGTEAIKSVTDVINHIVANAGTYFSMIKEMGANLVEIFKALFSLVGAVNPEIGKTSKELTTVEKVSRGIAQSFAAINKVLITIGTAIRYIGGIFQAVQVVIVGIQFALFTVMSAVADIGIMVAKGIGGAFNAVASSVRYVFLGTIELILKLLDKIRGVIAKIVETMNKIDILGLIPDELVQFIKTPIGGRGFIGEIARERRGVGAEVPEAWEVAGVTALRAARRSWQDFTIGVSAGAHTLAGVARGMARTFADASVRAADARAATRDLMENISRAASKAGGTWRKQIDTFRSQLDKTFEILNRQFLKAQESAKITAKVYDEAVKQNAAYLQLTERFQELRTEFGLLGDTVNEATFITKAYALEQKSAAQDMEVALEEYLKALIPGIESFQRLGDTLFKVSKVTEAGGKVTEYYSKTQQKYVRDVFNAEKNRLERVRGTEAVMVKITEAAAAEKIKAIQVARKKELAEAESLLKARWEAERSRLEKIKALHDEAAEHVKQSQDRIAETMKSFGDTTISLAHVVRLAASDIRGSIEHIAGLTKRAETATAAIEAAAGGGKLRGGLIEGKQGGGLVSGHGRGDRVWTRTEPQEYVIQRSAVEHFGSDFFDALNQMVIPQRGGDGQQLNVEVVLVPSDDFVEQVITRGEDTILGIIDTHPKRIRKTLGMK